MHFGSSAACLSVPLAQWAPQPAGAGQTLHFYCILGDVSRDSPAHGMSVECVALVPGWMSPPKHSHAPAQPLHTQPRPGTVRVSLPTLVVQHLLPVASKEDLSPAWQLWPQDKALWLSVQPAPATDVLVCCSQTETNWTETQRTLQNAVVKGLGGSWRHRPYGFVGRDGCPERHLAEGTCFVLPRQSSDGKLSCLEGGAHSQALSCQLKAGLMGRNASL